MQYTVYICVDSEDDTDGSTQTQTSSTLQGAVVGVVAKLNQALSLYEEANYFTMDSLEQLLEVCDSHDWELRLVCN